MASEFAERQKKDFIRDISALGSLFFYILAMVLFLLLKNYDLLCRLALGLALVYIVTIILRTFCFKERPNKLSHNSLLSKLDAASFPSLHASRTAYMAAALMNYFGSMMISILLVLLALGISYARIYMKKHDLKDVSAGIILGILAYFVINLIF